MRLHLASALASIALGASSFACSDSGGGTGGSGGSVGVAGPSTTITTGAGPSSSSTSTTASGVGGGGGAPVAMELLHEEGRFDLATAGKPAFTWSGTSIGTRFDGACASISVSLEGAKSVWFQVEIDGAPTDKFITTGGAASYPIAMNLPAGTHDVRIVRRNEGFFGTVRFVSFDAMGCQQVESPVPHVHRVEYIGDSITNGYGIEGTSATCNFTGGTETVYSTYAAIAARNLDASAHFIAYSGKGVHQNYGGNTTELMPELYLRTLTNDAASTYDFSLFDPDLVVVNLGTNDFSAAIDTAAFVADYEAFLGAIRQRRPTADIICVTWAHWGASKEALVKQAVTAFGDPKVHTTQFQIKASEGLGCNSHPNLVTHARLGMEFTSFVQTTLGW